MLILTRRIGENIRIGNNADIIVKVIAVNGNQVRLGIDAPRDVTVHREEIWLKIEKEQELKLVVGG